MDRVPSLETTEQLLAHTAWLTRVARALTNSADDAEELVQQTWLKALERPPAHGGNLRGWLATLARNLVRSRRRSSEREAARVRALPRPEPASGPEESVARAELQQVLLDAVLALAEPYRSTLVMRFLDELSAEEIAQKSSVPVETVRTRVKRGLDQVRARVAQKLGAEREQLPALLAPLVGAGALVVTSTTKIGLLIGAAAAVLATTLVLTRARNEGGARGDESAARSLAPAAAAAAKETGVAQAVATRVAEMRPSESKSPAASTDTFSTTFDVSGIVVDTTGAPVADATVFVVARGSSRIPDLTSLITSFIMTLRDHSSMSGVSQELKADAAGEFSLRPLDRSLSWQVAAFHPEVGFTSLSDVAPTKESPAPHIELAMLPSTVVRGLVLDAAGRPATHATVSFQLQWLDKTAGSTFQTRSNGRFELPPMPIVELRIYASDEQELHRSKPIDLRGDDGPSVRDLTLQLESAPTFVTLRGRVVDGDGRPLTESDSLMQRFADWERQPLSPATLAVILIPKDVPQLGARLPDFFDGIGRVGQKDGTYTCKAYLDDELRPKCAAVVARNRIVAIQPIGDALLDPDSPTHEVADLVVDPGLMPSDPADGALIVHLTDAATGESLVDPTATITLLARWPAGRGTSMMEATGSSSRPQVLPPCRCEIIVKSKRFISDWAEIEIVPRVEPYEVTVALHASVRSIRGTVTARGGAPVAGASVHWLAADGDSMRAAALDPVTTDEAGHFCFAAVGASRGRLAVECPDFAPAFADVEAGKEELSRDVQLQHGVTVSFQCRPDPNGSLPSADIQITTKDGGLIRQDWNARFTRREGGWPRRITLAPGHYQYQAVFSVDADAPAGGDFDAVEGAEIVITPTAR